MFIELEIDFVDSVIALLQQHLDSMASVSPPESVHALDVEGLKAPEVTFWCLWSASKNESSAASGESRRLMGCGALKEFVLECANGTTAVGGEIKSMKTADDSLRRGVARKLLEHIIEQAHQRGYQALYLETGSTPEFDAAHQLYLRFGFVDCEPFGDYVLDPFSRFMHLDLKVSAA